MSWWNLYFLCKLSLFVAGHLQPWWPANLAFAVCLTGTAPVTNRAFVILRRCVGVTVAIPLAWHETNVPPFTRLVSEFHNLQSFSLAYWLELLPRFLPSPLILVTTLGVMWLYFAINRRLRVATFVIIGLSGMYAWQLIGMAWSSNAVRSTTATNLPVQAQTLESILREFRTLEAQRSVTFTASRIDPAAQFDVILLHVCSLSWDDLDAANARNHELLSRFDYLFTNFSTAASYSTPAVIRLLRATCGQQPHDDLYRAAPTQCHLMAQLAQAGFTPQVLMNHDGRFDNFLPIVRANIGVPHIQVQPNAAPVAMHAFDGSAIHDDLQTLSRWYARRRETPGPVALYYNTLSLHDGNRLPNSKLTSIESYPQRVTRLLDDVERFMKIIEASGRRAVVVLVPEHGAALRADRHQVAGVREIPTPRIVHGPAGVRLVGFPGADRPMNLVIDTPTSFLALAQLLSNVIDGQPNEPGTSLAQYAANLPTTLMIGENESMLTLKTAAGYAVRTSDEVWVEEQ